jgi:hypothetical protein
VLKVFTSCTLTLAAYAGGVGAERSAGFEVVRIRSTVQDFAADNISVAEISDPAGMLLLAAGLAGMALAGRGRRT